MKQNKEGISLPFSFYMGWWLLIPVCLSLLYGIISHHVLQIMEYPQKDTILGRLGNSLPALFLFTLWSIINIPLPVFYILAFFTKVIRLYRRGESRSRELFLINITHLTTMALHMVLIGVFSLAVQTSMRELLQYPFWRILTISMVLIINNLVALLLPRWETIMGVLRTQAESAEVRPFMMFLWFCNIFLLLDSILCMADVGWDLLPLFLVGSTVLMEFYLIRFLRHLYLVLKVYYLEEEHLRLTKELEQQNQDAAVLRSKSEQDSMTGIYSRQYLIDKARELLERKVPFSFVFIDLDHLKRINDREGHHAGDIYLIQFTEEFASHLRDTDIFARVGGDEFVVLLLHCVGEKAIERMDLIRSRLTVDLKPGFSFSYGVSYVAEDTADSLEQIFHKADQAMYRDKQTRKY